MKKLIFISIVTILNFLFSGSSFSQQEADTSKIHFAAPEIETYLKNERPYLYKMLMKLRREHKFPNMYTISDWTQISDLVVIGRVQKIEGHPESPYHSWIYVHVDSILKGKPNHDPIVVKIISGPLDSRGKYGTEVVDDAKFKVGEKVLIFLSTVPRLQIGRASCRARV